MSEINPITREEMFLAAASGQNIQLPEPITRVEMFLAKIAAGGGTGGGTGGGSSAPSDWNASEGQPGHVLNRTHWVETVDPVFNGDLTGREYIFLDPDYENAYAVKVTPQIVSVNELIGATMVISAYGSEDTTTIPEEAVSDTSIMFGVPGAAVILGRSPIVLSLKEGFTMNGASFSSGTWILLSDDGSHVKSLSCLDTEIIHKMDEKFLPMDEIAAHVLNTLPTWNGGSY